MINQKEFIRKKTNLEQVKTQLKQEYFGIDEVIDQILDAMSGWYYFSDLQERPVVINLWGLTGTGKTSLVKRIFSLLEMEKSFFNYDSRELKNEYTLYEIMESVDKHYQGLPFALLVDEFQHAKTINEKRQEQTVSGRADLWELLDSGELTVTINTYDLDNIRYLIGELRLKIALGMKGKRGKIIEEPSEIVTNGVRRKSTHYKAEAIISDNHLDTFTALNPKRFKDEQFVREHLMTLDEKQTLSFLQEVYDEGRMPRYINAKRALIFIAGNLDEAYSMSREIEQEVDADELHERSQKITLSDIKIALQKRFRNEQIARLGNIHIVYPSLSKKAYDQLLSSELGKISTLMYEEAGLKLEFDQSLIDGIYEEGVAPAQGTRSLFSTIQLWIRGQLGRILIPVVENGLDPDSTILYYKDRKILIAYKRAEETIYKSHYAPHSANERARKNKEKGLRYIVSVHEAGHIIASIKLLNHVPKNASSLSVSSSRDGYVSIERPKSYYEKDIINWMATLLAGGVAEKQVFGKKHVPIGAGQDYRYATQYILDLLKSGSLGEIPGFYAFQANSEQIMFDNENRFTGIAEQWIQRAQAKATELLIRNEKPLIILAEQMLDKNYLTREDLTSFTKQHLNHQIIPLEACYESSFRQKLASVKDGRI